MRAEHCYIGRRIKLKPDRAEAYGESVRPLTVRRVYTIGSRRALWVNVEERPGAYRSTDFVPA